MLNIENEFFFKFKNMYSLTQCICIHLTQFKKVTPFMGILFSQATPRRIKFYYKIIH